MEYLDYNGTKWEIRSYYSIFDDSKIYKAFRFSHKNICNITISSSSLTNYWWLQVYYSEEYNRHHIVFEVRDKLFYKEIINLLQPFLTGFKDIDLLKNYTHRDRIFTEPMESMIKTLYYEGLYI